MNNKPRTISIHGKNYVPVSERIKMAGNALESVDSEVLQYEPIVVIRVRIRLTDGEFENTGAGSRRLIRTFTGISSANPGQLIEKTNPYEVAETSALGRALGFAGYGLDEGIASADEVTKYPDTESSETIAKRIDNRSEACPQCHAPAGKAHASSCPTLK